MGEKKASVDGQREGCLLQGAAETTGREKGGGVSEAFGASCTVVSP